MPNLKKTISLPTFFFFFLFLEIRKRRILDAATRIPQPGNGAIVRKARELLLRGLGEHGAFDVRVRGRFRREFGGEVFGGEGVGLCLSSVPFVAPLLSIPQRKDFFAGQRENMDTTHHVGFKGWVVLSLQQLPPVDTVKEVVRFNLRSTIGTETSVGAAIQELGEEIFGGGRHNLWARKVKGLREDLAVHFIGVLIVVGWKAGQHFVEEDAKGPPINRLGVALAEQ